MINQKCYIAGKISGLPEKEWKQNFLEARNEVKEMGLIPVCPTELPHKHPREWQDYMREALIALLSCDCVYAQRGWMDSPGARIEINLAKSIRMHIIYQ